MNHRESLKAMLSFEKPRDLCQCEWGYWPDTLRRRREEGMPEHEEPWEAAGMDIRRVRQEYPDLIIAGGIDKREIAKGKQAIDTELESKLPPMFEKGGYFPSLDHHVPPEVSRARAHAGALSGDLVQRWRKAIKRLDVCSIARDGDLKTRVHLLAVGDLKALFVPGEWFNKLGREVCDRFAPLPVWITTLADFDLLYLPDRRSRSRGDWYGVSPEMRTISDDGIDRLVDAACALVEAGAAG